MQEFKDEYSLKTQTEQEYKNENMETIIDKIKSRMKLGRCPNCGSMKNVVHCGSGTYLCKKCLDTIPQKIIKEILKKEAELLIEIDKER